MNLRPYDGTGFVGGPSLDERREVDERREGGGLTYQCADCVWTGRGGAAAYTHHRDHHHHRIQLLWGANLVPVAFGCCHELAEGVR